MSTLAVVPILVTAGTSVLPALSAAIFAVFAILLRPREWVRICRGKPRMAVAAIAIVGALILIFAGLTRQRPVRREGVKPIDWARVALEIIQREQASPLAPFSHETRGDVAFRFNASRCGFDGGSVPQNLRPLWAFKQQAAWFLSSPTVVGDRVYGASCVADVTGNFGSIFCLDAESGRALWQVEKIDGTDLRGVFSSPAITGDGKHLVIGEGLHFDDGCRLICLDAETGKLRWKIDVPQNHIEGSPAILGDIVIAGAGAIEHANHLPPANPGYVFGVRISDGKMLWRHDVIDPESSPAIAADGVVYIGSGVGGNAIVALRIESDDDLRAKNLSRILWRTVTPYPATGAATLADDLVLIGAGLGDFVNSAPHPAGAVLALDRHTGAIRWQKELGDAVLGPISVRDGRAICPGRSGKIVALDVASGRELWSWTSGNRAPVLAGAAIAAGKVFVVSNDGFLAVLDARDGRLIEKHFLNDEAGPSKQGLSLSSPTLARGRLFVGSESGGLRCFTGSPP